MAIEIYKDWLAIAPDAMAYRSYSQALKKQGKTDESKQILEEAIKKYPKDATLLVDKINTYLENAQYQDALTYVNNLIEVEPKNDGAYFIKGLAYEKIGNEDSVVYYYTKTAEINPTNIKPWNNLGALYVNKANTMLEDMNKLGNSSADIKKYEELKKQRKELYLKAKPYLEKAKAIEPNDPQINKTLKQIELYTTE
jgi:Flp pilus assembly protein TadD